MIPLTSSGPFVTGASIHLLLWSSQCEVRCTSPCTNLAFVFAQGPKRDGGPGTSVPRHLPHPKASGMGQSEGRRRGGPRGCPPGGTRTPSLVRLQARCCTPLHLWIQFVVPDHCLQLSRSLKPPATAHTFFSITFFQPTNSTLCPGRLIAGHIASPVGPSSSLHLADRQFDLSKEKTAYQRWK